MRQTLAHPPEIRLVAPARRVNPRRDLLLVSTVLGKHIPVAPVVPLATGAALALRAATAQGVEDPRASASVAMLGDSRRARALWESLRAEPVQLEHTPAVLGFAETATALGWATAACLRGATYLHTTRAPGGAAKLAFSEEHSHAPEHRLEDRPSPLGQLLLVDDEVTTGRTAHNLVGALGFGTSPSALGNGASPSAGDGAAPRARNGLAPSAGNGAAPCAGNGPAPTLLTLVDSSGMAGRDLGLTVVALHTIADGRYRAPLVERSQPAVAPPGTAPRPHRHAALRTHARTTVAADLDLGDDVLAIADLVARHRRGGRLLCLGTGEFMYLPMLVAAALGDDVHFGATTRSPICVSQAAGYPIRHGLAFVAPDDPRRTEYVYNVTSGRWDSVAVFLEGTGDPQRLASLHAALRSAGYPDPMYIEVTQR